MNSYRKELWFNLPSRRGFVNITPEVERCLRESGISEGLMLINGRKKWNLPVIGVYNCSAVGSHQNCGLWKEVLNEKPGGGSSG